MTRRFTRLLRDQRGAALIEFAILAPVFIGLLLCIFEISIVTYFQSTMQTSVEQAGRTVLVGKPQRANFTSDQFRQQVCATLPAAMTCSKVSIDVRSAPSLAALLAQPTPSILSDGYTGYSPGGPGTYNIVRLGYRWDVISVPPDFNLANAGPGKRLMETTTIVKVEPYNI